MSSGGIGAALGKQAWVEHDATGTEKRKFTIDELKRICAFPDDFILCGSYAQQWERLGNSVPPLMMQAIAHEPNYAPFLTNACWALAFRIAMGWPTLTGDDRTICLDLARRALANAQGDAAVLALCGNVLVNIGQDYDRGMQIVANAVETNPNNQTVLIWAGIAKIHYGNLEESLAHSRRAILMSPGDPTAHLPMSAIAHAYMALGNYEEALKAAERSLAVNPDYDATYWMLIAANAQLGRMDEAQRWLAKFRTLAPGVTINSIRAGQPAKDPSRMAAILEGLRLAGLDES